MKNLFTYKNNIASGLKRYGKFLLLAISLLFVSNTAWAAAPTEMWLRYNIKSDKDSYEHSDMEWAQMEKISDTQWYIELTLNNSDNNFYFGTGNTYAKLISSNINIVVTDKPACVTITQTGDFGASAGNKRKLYLGSSKGANCKIAFTVNYVEGDNNPYQISLISGCDDAVPTVTTGTMTLNANNQPQISGNNLISLGTCSDGHYDTKGVEITTNKSAQNHDRYTEVTAGNIGETLGEYEITARIGLNPNTTYYYRAYAINNIVGVGYGEWKEFNTNAPSGTPPSIRIGKQPVVSNLTDVAMNFQMADWGCTKVTKVWVYYTVTDIKTTNSEAPTTESSYWEFDTEIEGNINFDLLQSGLPSGNYNIKAVACNSIDCSKLSDMASFTIQGCEKPAVPKINNPVRNSCQFLIAYCQKEASNNLLVLVNDVEQGTITPPTDGSEYTGKIAPDGVGVEKIKENQNETQINITGLDGNTEYTVTCYQYVPATKCYSEPATYVIEKVAPVIDVEMTYITTKSATANIRLTPFTGTAIRLLRVTLSEGGNIIQKPEEIQKTLQDNEANYVINNLNPNTTYTLQIEAESNNGCQTTEVVEFTTGICYVPEVKTVSGVNTVGKVEATITMENSDARCIYQLFIKDTAIDTAIDGSAQEGTGSNLQWIVNQAGTYIVKAWFNTEVVKVPNYCFNAPVKMDEYTLACTQTPTPVISISENTICSGGAGATITVTALDVDDITYKLYKDGVEQDNVIVNGEFTGITAPGTYSVVAVGNAEDYCNTSSTSQAVTLTVIDANASVTISPSTATTNPWVPVAFTVESTNDSPYTLVYKTGDVDVTSQMVVTQTDNSYQLKIPRPENWAKGNASAGKATYTVEATLQIAGDVNCGSSATLTITLEDTFDNCD